jgi:hypothetical protein
LSMIGCYCPFRRRDIRPSSEAAPRAVAAETPPTVHSRRRATGQAALRQSRSAS